MNELKGEKVIFGYSSGILRSGEIIEVDSLGTDAVLIRALTLNTSSFSWESPDNYKLATKENLIKARLRGEL